jgi:hypothetical protein
METQLLRDLIVEGYAADAPNRLGWLTCDKGQGARGTVWKPLAKGPADSGCRYNSSVNRETLIN